MESNSNNNPRNSFQRATAFKIDVSKLKEGNFIQKEGFEPSYLDTIYGEISRVNLIGAIISKSVLDNTIEIEDGSGRINLRQGTVDYSNINFDSFELGTVINVIGKIRNYSGENYIIPEIIKEIKNLKWVELRKLELKDLKPIKSQEEINDNKLQNTIINQENIDDSENVDDDKNSLSPDFESVINTIKKLDNGEGADSEEIIKESKISNGKDILNKLLEIGEIFEIRPGKIKVLE
jgi:RPA family protein